jgi:hypothetical protein
MMPSFAQRTAPAPTTVAGLPVDAVTLFPAKDGFFARRARQRRTLVLERLREVLARALASGEVIRFATTCQRYSAFESSFAGAASYHHNQFALVATDRRALLLQIHGKRTGAIKNHLALGAVRQVKTGLFGRWKLKLGDGSTLTLTRIPGADRKALKAVLPGVAGPPVPAPALEALCPDCLVPVPGKVGATLTCPSVTCRIPFRDPIRAARLSGLVPGLGDLYLGHHLFGSIEFLGSMAVLGLGLGYLMTEPLVGALMAVLWLGVPRAIDIPLTLHMGRKGLVPLAHAPAPGAQPRNLPAFPAWATVLFLAGLALCGLIAWSVASAGPGR